MFFLENALFFSEKILFWYVNKYMFCIAGWQFTKIVLCISDPVIS